MPWVSSAARHPRRPRGTGRSPGPAPPRAPPASAAVDRSRRRRGRPRPPCAGSRRSGRARTGRSRPGSRSTASWPARCRSRSSVVAAREAKNQRAASTPTSASSSSRVMNSPARLLIETSTPSRTNRTQAYSSIWTASTVVAHRLGRVPDAGDRPVVVGAPDVDQLVEAAAELLGDVADVGGEVGRLAVRADDHPVLVVAERRRAEPQRAVLLVDVAARAQPLDRALDPAVVVERALALPDVEMDAEPRRGSPRSRSRTRAGGPAPHDGSGDPRRPRSAAAQTSSGRPAARSVT